MNRQRGGAHCRLRAPAAIAAALLLATGLGACGDRNDAASAHSRPELVVFAAASLGPAFEAYGSQLEDADVKLSLGGSDTLAAQIRSGVTPDVYAAADVALPAELHAEGLLERPRVFATNRLVVAVPADSEITRLRQLQEPGLKIAIGEPQAAPVGIYAREAIEALGPEAASSILANVASEEPDAGGIAGKLTLGAVDAGFVYASDVEAADGAIRALEIPAAARPRIAYGIAVAAGAAHPGPARELVEGILSAHGQDLLRDFGFGPAS